MDTYNKSRRDFLKLVSVAAIASQFPIVSSDAQTDIPDIEPGDRVFIANEDSNTVSVIDPKTNTIDTTINLTSFDEDPRPPFRFVTASIVPTHSSMIHKPLYHGCIDAHGVVPSPDGRMLATSGRGSSNVYLIDSVNKRVIGNTPNPFVSKDTNPERISSGILVGREPHEPTFTRDGKELWVAVRGEDRIAILDVELAIKESSGEKIRSVIKHIETINGPSQVWFRANGRIAFVASQKVSKIDIFNVNKDTRGYSNPERITTIDITEQDRFGFTPFLKTSPDGREVWFSHKLADAVSVRSTEKPFEILDYIFLGKMARPNHLEFVENKNGKVVYVSLARVDDGGPDGVASSQIAIIDRSEPHGKRKVINTFFSHGREAHGLWTNPTNKLLYIAHEQDELPKTPNDGQTVATAFDVSDPYNPKFIAQIPLGSLKLPSGELRNKKSINLVYVRPGYRGQTA